MKTARNPLGLLGLALLLSISIACNKKAGTGSNSAPGGLKTELDKVSYILGYSTSKGLSDQNVTVNKSAYDQGFSDGLEKDKKPLMTDEEMRDTMQSFRTTLMEQRRKDMEENGKKNEDVGKKFLAENKAKPGVVTLPSGLQYKVLTAGTGVKAKPTDSVNVEYTGKLINGTEFDSTKDKKPATFPVGQVIPGMSEALKTMPVGSTWEIYIPSNLAYGPNGMGKNIGPNETLIFNVHLVSIEKPAAAAAPAAPAAPTPKPAKK